MLECSTSDIQLTVIDNLWGRKRGDHVGETIDYEFDKKDSPAHKVSPAPRKARLVWKRVPAEVWCRQTLPCQSARGCFQNSNQWLFSHTTKPKLMRQGSLSYRLWIIIEKNEVKKWIKASEKHKVERDATMQGKVPMSHSPPKPQHARSRHADTQENFPVPILLFLWHAKVTLTDI